MRSHRYSERMRRGLAVVVALAGFYGATVLASGLVEDEQSPKRVGIVYERGEAQPAPLRW